MENYEIIRGEDVVGMPLYLLYQSSKRPYPLEGWTKIWIYFKKSDGSWLEKTTDLYGGAQAIQIYEGVTYTAENYGIVGNDIQLIFTGSNTIAQAVSTWNTTNPTNTVNHDADDDSVVPSAGTFNLSGGENQKKDVNVIDEKLSEITVNLSNEETNSLKTGKDLTFKGYIDKGNHPTGTRRKVIFWNCLNVVNDDNI